MMTLVPRFAGFLCLSLLAVVGAPIPAASQGDTRGPAWDQTPDLVVGITIDQMRPDYLFRYWDHLGEGGFKRLVNEGFVFRNGYFRHGQTSTGPGHAAQFTGASPSIHGLVGNSWYVRELERSINVIEAVGSGFRGVGSAPDYDGEKGPVNMLSTTFGDELYLHTGHRSRTVGISRKDRGAILPAGHTGQAYWFEGATGNFITSTFYRDALPGWLQDFNARNLARDYLAQRWEPLYPLERYVESREDENPYEGLFGGSATFPFDLPAMVAEGASPSLLNTTPFADQLLLELAMAAIEGEELGRGPVPDVLSIGLSATDAIGHRFGPASKQMQDHMIRLDGYLAEFFDWLDGEFGMENVLVFMTADHGGAYIPHYLRDHGIATGNPDTETRVSAGITAGVRTFLQETYGQDLLLAVSNQNLFLDHAAIRDLGLDLDEVRVAAKRFALTQNGVAGALTAQTLTRSEFTEGPRAAMQHAWHQKRSGDVVVWLEPQTRGDTGTGGTGHGTPWAYDLHVPIIFLGNGIPAGHSMERVFVSDIAPTVANFLRSPLPSGNIGRPLNDFLRER
jgi:hypothetical protein